jgi:tetratricopeptide (TPR) repeat protein
MLARVLALAMLVVLVAGATAQVGAQPSEADVYIQQAILDFDEKRYDEALANLRRALELEPEHAEALYYTGAVYMAQNRPAEAVPFLERARAKAPTEPSIAYQLGIAYFAQGKYDQAQPLLEEVFRREPRLDGLGYYVGVTRYHRKDYQGAIQAFSTGSASDPNLQQLARFYSGLSLAALGLPERAAAEVEQALRLQPASSLTGPAERLRESIAAARARERRFRAELRLGIFYDSNVPVAPRSADDALVRALRRQERESVGELFSARVEYSFLRSGPWEATAGYTFFQTVNNDIPSFDLQDHEAALGAVYRGLWRTMPYQLGSRYAFDFLTLGGDEFLYRHTVTLFATIAESSRHLSAVQARFQRKDFANDDFIPSDELRDGNNYMLGLTHIFRFARDKHLIRVGYQFDVDDTEGRNYSYIGHRLQLGGQYTLGWWTTETRFRYDYEAHFRIYDHKNSFLPPHLPGTRRRNDTEQIHVFRIEQPLPYNLTLAAEYQLLFDRSNLKVFSYDRNVVAVTLSWQY